MALLQAKNLRKEYPGVVAVAGIDLNVEASECVAILGANGAGKTTTVEMMEGLLTPTSGTVEIAGYCYSDNRRAIQQLIGVMLQETNMYKRMTVRETLMLFASFFEKPREINDLIHEFHLQEKVDAQLRTLSGGQKQRVFLACALINRPQVLFLDEPTTGLDPAARRFIWQLIRQHKQNGNAAVLTTHYMEEAETLADRVYLIAGGQVIASGPPKQLVEKEIGVSVVDIQVGGSEQPKVVQWLQEQYGEAFFRATAESVELFSGSEDEAWQCVDKLRTFCRADDVLLPSISVRPANLEDVFLKLTGQGLDYDK